MLGLFFSIALFFANVLIASAGCSLLDVAIIGAGHAGKGICHALQKEGIENIAIFEKALPGQESIWLTTARMQVLRSDKECEGPALEDAELTFRAWYERQGGIWKDLDKIPTILWGKYLLWFGEFLNLPIIYGKHLVSIEPTSFGMKLVFQGNECVYAKKVILTTGRDGFGGLCLPDFVVDLPKRFWFHTSEKIPLDQLRGKRVCIVGGGASGFDIAAASIESGCLQATMLFRRTEVKTSNYLFLHFKNWEKYFELPDREKIALLQGAFEYGFCPPPEALERLSPYKNFDLQKETYVQDVSFLGNQLTLHTNREAVEADFLILATGFQCNPLQVFEISSFASNILLWGDVIEDSPRKLALFPYLGPSFEFMEKTAGKTPFLKDVYCFNFGSYLSHGNTGIDLDKFPIGAKRIVKGIVEDLKKQR